MKLLIASDIHGSSYYCKKLVERIELEKPDKIILLGDILYHGPRNDLPKEYNPKEVIALLNQYKGKILSVRGNCDSEVDQMVLEFPIMSDYIILDIVSKSKNKCVFLTHGHIYKDNQNLPIGKDDILICGHTHIQKCEEYPEYTYMNCGSVSIPKGDGYHGYMIIDDYFYWKDLEGNIKQKY